MSGELFGRLFIIGIVLAEAIRSPHRWRNKQDRRRRQIRDGRVTGVEVTLMTLSFLGMWVMPPIYVFTSWLDFADYHLPLWAGWTGAAIFCAALWLLWRSHADLGINWSPALEIREEHILVTQGVYRYIRHPIYAAVLLQGIAQALLVENWIAGPAGLITFLLTYFVRVPQEERMMLDHFGKAYIEYMGRVGRVIPHASSR